MKTHRIMAGIAALVALATPVAAHHSTNLWYDMTKTSKLSGEFVELRWINPHSIVRFNVAKPDGTKELWQAETHGTIALAREGWRPKQWSPGEKVVITGNPSRKGTRTLSLLSVTGVNGKAYNVNPAN